MFFSELKKTENGINLWDIWTFKSCEKCTVSELISEKKKPILFWPNEKKKRKMIWLNDICVAIIFVDNIR